MRKIILNQAIAGTIAEILGLPIFLLVAYLMGLDWPVVFAISFYGIWTEWTSAYFIIQRLEAESTR